MYIYIYVCIYVVKHAPLTEDTTAELYVHTHTHTHTKLEFGIDDKGPPGAWVN